MASIVNSFRFSRPCLFESRFQTRISSANLTTVRANGGSFNLLNDKLGSRVNGGNGKKKKEDELEVLWDDGYGETTVKDYFELANDFIHNDGGPPRWFTPVDCGRPIKDSPLLLFLPGIDGLGLGLCLHHKTLGRVFEVRCLHIPVYDRTPFKELVTMVENTVKLEHDVHPDKPIYLVGDSFGGCLALAIAARNPSIDMILVLVNPATSIEESQLQPLFPILEGLPHELHAMVPYLLSFVMGDPIRMAMVNIDKGLPPMQTLQRLSENFTALVLSLGVLADIIPKETLLWKLKLLRTGASYANSRLHAVKAEVLVLASGKDNMLPSKDEAQRLSKLIKNCTIRNFNDNGHTLLLEDGVHLLAVIKGAVKYRRFRRHDFISDYIPPSHTEFELHKQTLGLSDIASPVMLSTLENGKIVKGIAGVPDEGPVVFVGYHMLWGLEVIPLVEEFLKERKVMVRGMAHPTLFSSDSQYQVGDGSYNDKMRQFGSVPVTPSYLYRLLATDSCILLYPGGVREALHRKGEEYQLFWPEQPEFVRMAARFEATIVPFGVVGEDDITELVMDYNDQMNTPFLRDWLKELNHKSVRVRGDTSGEVANQDIHFPIFVPKIPGRFYYLFGKPIKTKGRKELLKNKESANELYSHIKADIGNTLSYLKGKRERDPYRGIVQRTIYKASRSSVDNEVPTFEL
ncbi:hypothetical protein ACHQM5_026741 [Ranunculus cassubicifolius]